MLKKGTIDIGDNIIYNPDTKDENGNDIVFQTSVNQAGITNNVISLANKKWVVWSKEQNKVVITPAEEVSTNLTLSDVQGYVNGAKVINDACKYLFQNSELNIEARNIRSMTVKDLNEVYDDEDGIPLYKGDGFKSLNYLFYLNTEPLMLKAGFEKYKHEIAEWNQSNRGWHKFFFAKDVDGITIYNNGLPLGEIEGGEEKNSPNVLQLSSENAFNYITISDGNPVYIKNTLRSENTSSNS